jgi:hypothetical protein
MINPKACAIRRRRSAGSVTEQTALILKPIVGCSVACTGPPPQFTGCGESSTADRKRGVIRETSREEFSIYFYRILSVWCGGKEIKETLSSPAFPTSALTTSAVWRWQLPVVTWPIVRLSAQGISNTEGISSLGHHTDLCLSELRYGSEAIATLHERGVAQQDRKHPLHPG